MELEGIADKIMNHIDQYIEFRKHYILVKPTFDIKDKKQDNDKTNYLLIRYQQFDEFGCTIDNNKIQMYFTSSDGSQYASSYDICSFINLLSNNEIEKVIHIIQRRYMNKIIPFVDKSLDILSEIHDKFEALVFAPDSAFFKEFMAARAAKQ